MVSSEFASDAVYLVGLLAPLFPLDFDHFHISDSDFCDSVLGPTVLHHFPRLQRDHVVRIVVYMVLVVRFDDLELVLFQLVDVLRHAHVTLLLPTGTHISRWLANAWGTAI